MALCMLGVSHTLLSGALKGSMQSSLSTPAGLQAGTREVSKAEHTRTEA
jgi:hypothetical protein